MYRKNTSGQKLTVFAYDSTTNAPKTGDAANITAYVDKDNGGLNALADTSASEKSNTNAKGYYTFDLSQAETDATKLEFSAKSSTANVVVIAKPEVTWTIQVGGTGYPQADVADWGGNGAGFPVDNNLNPSVTVQSWRDTDKDKTEPLVLNSTDSPTYPFVAPADGTVSTGIDSYTTTDTGTTSSLVASGLSNTNDPRLYRGQVIKVTSGTYAGKNLTATLYDSTTDTLSFTPSLGAAFGNGVTFTLNACRPNRLSD